MIDTYLIGVITFLDGRVRKPNKNQSNALIGSFEMVLVRFSNSVIQESYEARALGTDIVSSREILYQV